MTPRYAPPYPGEMIRDIPDDEEAGWTVTGCARRRGVARNAISRPPRSRIGVSPNMVLVLERIGWGNGGPRMRAQADCGLAQAGCGPDAA